jgi:hypothetical protein
MNKEIIKLAAEQFADDIMTTQESTKCKCIICNKPMPDYDPKYCCSSYDCGCMGMPTEPPVCSNECFDKLMEGNRR